MPLPLIAITMGDPAGVGPEVCLQLLANAEVHGFATPLIFGDLAILNRCAEKTGLPLPEPSLVRNLPLFDDTDFEPGVVSARTGAAGYGYVLASIEAALAGEVAAVATAPLNKEALRAAGVEYPGHTEIFADKTGARRACMFQYSDEVRASFVTVHCGYLEVPALLTVERILDVIEDLIGPYIIIYTSTFFIKESNTPTLAAWHQDSTYWGLETPIDAATAWVALTEASPEAGNSSVAITLRAGSGPALLTRIV